MYDPFLLGVDKKKETPKNGKKVEQKQATETVQGDPFLLGTDVKKKETSDIITENVPEPLVAGTEEISPSKSPLQEVGAKATPPAIDLQKQNIPLSDISGYYRQPSLDVEKKLRADEPKLQANVVKDFFQNPTAKKANQFSAAFRNKFYSGDLNGDDIGLITKDNPYLQPQETGLSNQQIANKINAKTKRLSEETKAVNSSAFDYAIQKKDYDRQIGEINFRINNAKVGGNKIYVDEKSTSVPYSTIYNGQKLVDRDAFIEEQRNLKDDIETKKSFLDVDFKRNIYDPHSDTVVKDIITRIEERSKMFNDYSIQGDQNKIRTLVNEYLQDKEDPILMAYQSGDINPIQPFKVGTPANEITYVGKDGRKHQFQNDDYTDIGTKVYNYFKYEKPALSYADKKADEFLKKPENKKFEPIINKSKQINDYFDSKNIQDFESALKTTADSGAININNKYTKIIQRNPVFQQLIKQFTNKEGEIDKDAFDLAIKNNPSLKPIIAQRDKEINSLITSLNKKREQFIINGIKEIDSNLELDKEGKVSLKEISQEEIKKFISDYKKNYEEQFKEGIKVIEGIDEGLANAIVDSKKKRVGGFLTSGIYGARKGFNSMVESFARYYDIPQLRDQYTSKNYDDIIDKSDFIKDVSRFQGWTSLLKPSYYAYNVGQSLPYMAPAIAAGIATGGQGGWLVSGLLGGQLETVQNALDTYNEMYLNGVNENGVKLTENEAANAASINATEELLPNLIFSTLEFGAIARGLKPVSNVGKTTAAKEILKAPLTLGSTAIPEAVQEGWQGYIQQKSKDIIQGKPVMDLYDYMETDDFSQNFFGGLAGGAGFGAGGFVNRVFNANKNYQDWKKISEIAKQGYADFDKGVMRGYALTEQLNGRGAEFRDGLRIRIANKDYVDNDEKAELARTLAYSSNLDAYAKKYNLNPQNINGLTAAHNLAMADMYGKFAEIEKGTALEKVNDEKAKNHLQEAKNILSGNDKGTFYVLNQQGTPIFLTKRDADALIETGDIKKMIDEGSISGVSENLFKSLEKEEQKKLIPDDLSHLPTELKKYIADSGLVEEKEQDKKQASAKPVLSEDQQVIKKAIDSGEIKGLQAEIAKQALESPENAEQFLKEVADQVLNKVGEEAGDPSVAARRAYGETISNLAATKFPKTEQKVTEEILPEDNITVGDMIDKSGNYKGQRGQFYQNGQTVVFKPNNVNREYELGNIEEIKDQPISEFEISHESSVVEVNDKGNINVRGQEYVNNFSDPVQAINVDKDGNVVSVNLETADGKKRTFRGNIAEDIAYQIHLKELNQGNETTTEFENFLNDNEDIKKEFEPSEKVEQETEVAESQEENINVPRETLTPKSKKVTDRPSFEEFKNYALETAANVRDSSFDWRITMPLTQEERIGAIDDIKKGRKTKRAKRFLAAIQEMYDNDVVTVNRGRGNNSETVDIPMTEWFGLTPEEQRAVEELDDYTASIINDNDITLKNLNTIKHLFNGFPYTEEDFESVKKYITEQGKSNEEDKKSGSEIKTETIKPKEKEPRNIESQKADIEKRRKEELLDKTPKLFVKEVGDNQAEINSIKQQINAKYDAELAALEINQPKTEKAKETKKTEVLTEVIDEKTKVAVPDKSIKEKGKELAAKIRSLKTSRDNLQSNFFGIPVAIYDGLIETIATLVEKGASLADAIKQAIGDVNNPNFEREDFVEYINARINDFEFLEKLRSGSTLPEGKADIKKKSGQKKVDRISDKKALDLAKKIGYTKRYTEPSAIANAKDLLRNLDKEEPTNKAIRDWEDIYDFLVENGYDVESLELIDKTPTKSTKDLSDTNISEIADIWLQGVVSNELVDIEDTKKGVYREVKRVLVDDINAISFPSPIKWLQTVEYLRKNSYSAEIQQPYSLKSKAKRLAADIRSYKTKSPGLQANIFGIPLAIYDGAIETIATAIEGGAALIDAINEGIKYIRDNGGENLQEQEFTQHIQDVVEGEQPKINIETDKNDSETKRDRSRGAYRNLMGSKIDESIKKKFEENGINYKVSDNGEAQRVGKAIVQSFGVDEALRLARLNTFHPSVNSAVYSEVINTYYENEQAATDQREKFENAQKWANVYNEYAEKLTASGQFGQFAYQFYKTSPLGFLLSAKERLDERRDYFLAKDEKSLKEAFEALRDVPEFQDLFTKEVEEAVKKSKRQVKQENKKKIADAFDKLKLDKNNTYSSLVPPPIINGAIDAMKQVVLLGYEVADVIAEGVKYINARFKEGWNQEQFEKDFTPVVEGIISENTTSHGSRLEQYKKSLREQIKKLDEQITNKQRNAKKENKTELDDEAQQLIKERDEKKAQLNKLVPPQKTAEQILKNWEKRLSKLKPEARKELLTKAINEIVTSGGLDYEKFKQMYADALGLPSLTPEMETKLRELGGKLNDVDKAKEKLDKDPSQENINGFLKSMKEGEIASRQINDLLGEKGITLDRFLSIAKLNTLGLFNLFVNPFFNVWFMPVRFLESMVKTGLDYGLKYAGYSRSDGMYENTFYKQRGYFKGFGKGAKKSIVNMYTGDNQLDYFQKTTRQNLQPVESMKEIYAHFKKEKRLTNAELANAMMEAFPTMGMTASIISRALQIGDLPFRFAAERATAENIARQKGLKGTAKEAFILNPDEESKEKITKEGERAVMAQDNIITSALGQLSAFMKNATSESKARKAVWGAAKVVGATTQPFLKIPLNSALTTFELAVPEYALLRGIYHSVTGNRDLALSAFSRAVVGYAIGYGLALIAKAGLLSGTDDDKEKVGTAIYQGDYTGNNNLNYTGFKRWIRGGSSGYQDGDVTVDLNWLGIPGAIMKMRAQQYDKMSPQDWNKEGYFADLWERAQGSFSNGIKSGVFGNTSTLLSAIDGGGSALNKWVRGSSNVLLNSFDPSWLSNASKLNDKYKVDYSAMDLKDQLATTLKERFWMSDNSPKQITVWGEKRMDAPKGTNPVLYYYADITKQRPVDTDDFGFNVLALYNRTKEDGAIPSRPQKTLRSNNQSIRLSPKKYEEFQVMVGQNRKQLVKALMSTDEYNAADDDTKIKLLKKQYSNGYQLGKDEFTIKYPDLLPSKKEEDE